MEQMGFWTDPDIKATAENANIFLYKQCQRLSLRAGVSLSSPQLLISKYLELKKE